MDLFNSMQPKDSSNQEDVNKMYTNDYNKQIDQFTFMQIENFIQQQVS